VIDDLRRECQLALREFPKGVTDERTVASIQIAIVIAALRLAREYCNSLVELLVAHDSLESEGEDRKILGLRDDVRNFLADSAVFDSVIADAIFDFDTSEDEHASSSKGEDESRLALWNLSERLRREARHLEDSKRQLLTSFQSASNLELAAQVRRDTEQSQKLSDIVQLLTAFLIGPTLVFGLFGIQQPLANFWLIAALLGAAIVVSFILLFLVPSFSSKLVLLVTPPNQRRASKTEEENDS